MTESISRTSLDSESQVKVVATAIQNIRVQRFQAEVTQLMNGHAISDIHPDATLSYEKLYEGYDSSEARLHDRFEMLMPRVLEILNPSGGGAGG